MTPQIPIIYELWLTNTRIIIEQMYRIPCYSYNPSAPLPPRGVGVVAEEVGVRVPAHARTEPTAQADSSA